MWEKLPKIIMLVRMRHSGHSKEVTNDSHSLFHSLLLPSSTLTVVNCQCCADLMEQRLCKRMAQERRWWAAALSAFNQLSPIKIL
jgi:hypothetical protein